MLHRSSFVKVLQAVRILVLLSLLPPLLEPAPYLIKFMVVFWPSTVILVVLQPGVLLP
jgi:hypothetical protein